MNFEEIWNSIAFSHHCSQRTGPSRWKMKSGQYLLLVLAQYKDFAHRQSSRLKTTQHLFLIILMHPNFVDLPFLIPHILSISTSISWFPSCPAQFLAAPPTIVKQFYVMTNHYWAQSLAQILFRASGTTSLHNPIVWMSS